jgi:hypothetical protein
MNMNNLNNLYNSKRGSNKTASIVGHTREFFKIPIDNPNRVFKQVKYMPYLPTEIICNVNKYVFESYQELLLNSYMLHKFRQIYCCDDH